MRAVDIIDKKKKGKVLTEEEIDYMVEGFDKGEIPDYQMAAFLMAVYFQGMKDVEISCLTDVMAHSGDCMDLSPVRGVTVDKHSTGGVGDKTSLILAPMVAAVGVSVAKMSGRGLGHTGGTIDKLESIPGFNTALSEAEFFQNVNGIGIALTGQTGNLAPADKKIYALRDVTATVDSIPLIASSIMSKKIASGAGVIVLDVKCGSGAFMKELDRARQLAQTMVSIGKKAHRKMCAVISDMNQPLGNTIGNGIEVMEAIDTLKGKGPKDLTKLCLTLGGYMVYLSGRTASYDEAYELVKQAVESGAALNKFKEFIGAQKGDVSVVDDYKRLPQPALTWDIYWKDWEKFYAGQSSPSQSVFDGENLTVCSIDCEKMGIAAMVLGGGRAKKGDEIDLSVGLRLHKKVGDRVADTQPVVTIYGNDCEKMQEAKRLVLESYQFGSGKAALPELIIEVLQ